MTGTSTRTPTTVARAAPELSPKRLIATATASSKKFEVPIRAQGAATPEGHPPGPGGGIGDEEDTVGLDQQRHGDEDDDQGLGQDRFALKTEQQHHGGEQTQHGDGLDAGRKTRHGSVPGLAATGMAQQPLAGDRTGDQRDQHIEPDREQQRVPRHGDLGNTQQQRNQRREGEDHDDVVHRDLNQRIGRITARELRPDEHHRRTGSRAK